MIVRQVLHSPTPLISAAGALGQLVPQLWLKMECWQPAGSFKIRGIGALAQDALAKGAPGLVSSSGGNAGYAAAFAGRALALPVHVFVPAATSATVVAALQQQGAEVRVGGDDWQAAHAMAQRFADDAGFELVHPFDDPRLWPGHATLVEEVAADGCHPDLVIVAVGGGGLLAGIAHGLNTVGLSATTIMTTETSGAASFYAALQAGERVILNAIESSAKSLGARQVSARAFALRDEFKLQPRMVSDAQAISAAKRFAIDHRTLVEPACGAALALAYARDPAILAAERPLMVVCGGIACDLTRPCD